MKTELSPGDIVEGTLTSLEYGGLACGKFNGALLYVPRGAPGDVVRVRVKKLRKNFGSADIEEIVTPSSSRVAPNCPAYHDGCGGCQWLHIGYPVQLAWKEKILNKIFSKTLEVKIEAKPVVPMRAPGAFRNKLSLISDDNGRFGFMKENSKTLVYFDHCPMALPLVARVHKKLLRLPFPPAVTQLHVRGTRDGASLVMYAERLSPAFQKTAKILARAVPELESIAVRTRAGVKLLDGIPFITQRVGRLEYRIPPDAFFQTNYFQALTLLENARRLLALTPEENLVDLYSGVGFFSLDLAPHASRVLGIEGNRGAVEAARLSARINKSANVDFRAARAEDGLSSLRPGTVDAMLLDPPRAGCDESVLREIVRLHPRRLVYFSCDPETMARDCSWLIDRGYLIGEILPVDMFPHTYHIEAAIKLVSR